MEIHCQQEPDVLSHLLCMCVLSSICKLILAYCKDAIHMKTKTLAGHDNSQLFSIIILHTARFDRDAGGT